MKSGSPSYMPERSTTPKLRSTTVPVSELVILGPKNACSTGGGVVSSSLYFLRSSGRVARSGFSFRDGTECLKARGDLKFLTSCGSARSKTDAGTQILTIGNRTSPAAGSPSVESMYADDFTKYDLNDTAGGGLLRTCSISKKSSERWTLFRKSA